MGPAALMTEHMANACPFCGGMNFATWRFGLLRCAKCELIVDAAVWRPAANEQMVDTFFGESYEPVRSFWVRMFESINNRRTMGRLRSNQGVAGSLLEIGVGSGSFLAYAQTRGFDSLGCDLSAAICRRVERNTGLKMHWGPLESLPGQQKFDVIVINHVLEHVSDPLALLRTIRVRLKVGGLLHLAVPNVIAWEARLPGWNSYEPYHLLYFTPRTLRATAEAAGFEVLELNTHESFSGWFLAVLRTLLKQSHSARVQQRASTGAKPLSSLLEHGYRLTTVLWGAITLPLRQLQGHLGRGDEVILLARKAENGR